MSLSATFYLVLYLAATYFICGIPFGKLIAAQGAKVDIRSVGSGNIGTTNVARSLGPGLAALTLLGDAGKGFICTFFAPSFISNACGIAPAELVPSATYDWICAAVMLFCILGHVFSPYLHFHGGKGIATGFGASLGFAWPISVGLFVVFALFAAAKRIVSLASCAAAISLPIWALIIYRPSGLFILIMAVISAIVLFAHRSNLAKLARGEEKTFSFHHNETTSQKG